MADSGIFVRPIIQSDRQMVADLIFFERYVHRHLDWRQPLDWIGHNPFLVGTKNGKIEAVLACPVNKPEIPWIRLLVISSYLNLKETWLELWSTALTELTSQNNNHIAAISLHDWFSEILINNQFSIVNQVVTLIHTKDNLPPPRDGKNIKIREMTTQDLDHVAVVDVAAFNPLWCYARDTLALAFGHTIIATVAEVDQLIVGYQISTVNHSGGHLARLAVLPGYQGKGIGYQLLRNELDRFHHRGIWRITVNTQQDNLSSLSLYEQAGFEYIREKYPVFQFQPPE